MVVAAWSQGGPPPNQFISAPQPQRRTTNPPPVCFNCGVEGHFVVNCPQSSQGTPVGFSSTVPAPTPYQQYPVPGPPAQQYQPRPGPQYIPYAQTSQYGQPAPQQQYNQPPPQPYVAPVPVNPHQPHARPGYQPPAYNQAPQANGPPQFGGQAYQGPPQNYGPQGPIPYQTPPNHFSPQNSGYQAPPSNFQGPPQQQWNNQIAQPYQQTPQRSASFSSSQSYARTPIHQSQQQPFQPPQQMTPRPVQTPQTPLSGTSSGRQGQWTQVPEPSPVVNKSNTAKDSTPTSTAPVLHEANPINVAQPNSLTTNSMQEESTKQIEKVEMPEDGEVTEQDDEQEQWEWDYKYIFPDSPVHETVALAQPLGASFKSTPVPLIQAWSTAVPSISRYARKDNVKEFIRSIRVSPQWPFVQADPAFNDSTLDGPLIPIDEVFEWAAARHASQDTAMIDAEQKVPEADDSSRKRLRPEDFEEDNSEQDDVDNQLKLEAGNESHNKTPRNKRQKNDGSNDQEAVIPTTYGPTTPVLATNRGGTPFLPTDDDAWAPQPGERASSPGDPTEALLASLGVSGSPKPVKTEPMPPYAPSEDQSPQQRPSETPVASRTNSIPPPPPPQTPAGSQQGWIPPPPPQTPAGGRQGWASQQYSQNPQAGPPSFVPPQATSTPQKGPPTNTTYHNGPPQYGTPVNQQYGNAQHPGQHSMNGTPQHRPPMNGPFQNAPPNNISYPIPQPGPPVPQGAPNYGPPVNQPYYHGPPQNYGQPPAPQYQPPQPTYGNPAPFNGPPVYPQYGPSHVTQYGAQQFGPPTNPPRPQGPAVNTYQQNPQQYGPPRNQSFGNGPPAPGPYGPQQHSPAQYGPPQNQSYVNQNQNQSYHNGPSPTFTNGSGSQNNLPFHNGQAAQSPFSNGPTGQMPNRQDSGYGSARGSYSNGGGASDFNSQNTAYDQNQQPNFGEQNGPQQIPQNTFNQSSMQQQNQQAGFGNRSEQHTPQDNFHYQNGQNSQNGGQTPAQHGGLLNEDAMQQQGQQPFQTQQPSSFNSTQDENNASVTQENQPTQEDMPRKCSLGDNGDSPLSPTSAEILGKLEGKPNSVKAEHSRRKEEARKKKPQPVVAAAYGRRW